MSEKDYPDIERVTIKSEKELFAEFENFDKLLVDTNKDWSQRLKGLKRLEGIILGGGFDYEEFPAMLTKLYLHINAQLNDLRSAISKEACRLVSIAAEYGQELIESLCEKLIHKQFLLKLINSGTKVIAENGHECIINLLNYVRCPKVIPRIIEEASSKNTAVRQKLSQYINIIVDIFENNVLEKHQHILEEVIFTLISDANKDVRQYTRQTFSIYSEKFPARGEKMFSCFDASVTKILIDEGLVESIPLAKTTSLNSTKSTQRTSSTSAKKDAKSAYSSPTSTLGRTSGSNGFTVETSGKMGSPHMTRASTVSMDEDRKIVTSKVKVGMEKKKGIEVSSAEIKGPGVPVLRGSNSLGISKSNSEESTRPPTRTSSKIPSQRVSTKDTKQSTPNFSKSDLDYENSSVRSLERKEEELYQLIDQTDSEDWATRANAFEQINEFISDLKPHEQISNNLMDKLIQAHTEHMNDTHYKVVVACQESFSRLLTIYHAKILPYLDQIIPLLFVNLTEGKEKVSASTNFLINLINKIYSGDELLPHFLKSIESSSKIKYKTSIVEFMNILIRNCETFFNSANGIKVCVNKFAYIIGELTSTKSIVMPCLGMILYLRDLNLNTTIAALGSLNPDLLTKIRTLASEYAPDLEENISLYVQAKGFAKSEGRTSVSTSVSLSKTEALQNKTNYSTNGVLKKNNNVELKSKPIPESDLNSYGFKEKIAEKSVERDTKRIGKEKVINGGRLSTSNMSAQGDRSSRIVNGSNSAGMKPKDNGLANKSVSKVDKSLSHSHSDSERLQTDTEDFLQAESMAERGEISHALADRVKIESLLRAFPKSKTEIQQNLEQIILTLTSPVPADDTKTFEYTVGVLLNLLKLPLDFSESIETLITNIIGLFTEPRKSVFSFDEVLKAALELGYIEQSLWTLVGSLEDSEHPIVQIIVKNITKLILQDENETYLEFLPNLIKKYKELIHHSNPDVRKNVVFSIVELHFINEEEISKYIDTFSPNHQKLISIYIQKKGESKSQS